MEQKLKIAVPTRDSVVDDHFGHCSYYTIYGVEEGKVVSKESYPSPQGCGLKSSEAAPEIQTHWWKVSLPAM